jgi:hypothetical protein
MKTDDPPVATQSLNIESLMNKEGGYLLTNG